MSMQDPAATGPSDPMGAPPPPPPVTATPPSHPGATFGPAVGKVRNPWGAWGLSLITLGIYYLYWWYKVNEEVRAYDPTIKVEPGLSVLALFVPIANIVTIVKTGGRIGQAERNAGAGQGVSGGLGFLLAILFATHIVYYQQHLNGLWEREGVTA